MDFIDWKDVAKRELRSYPHLKDSIKTLQNEIQHTEEEKTSLRSISDSPSVQGGSSTAEDRLNNLIIKADALKKNLYEARAEVQAVEDSLRHLTKIERQVVGQFALNRSSVAVENLISAIGYERTQIYKIWDQAVRKFVAARYGKIV